MAESKNYIGLNQFVTFYGVVEDRIDPTQTGRVRVRCLGFHTKDKEGLPTADLPWAQVLLPVTSSGISGIGQTPLGLVEGSWVVGYFRDGADAQEPIVLGSLPGKPAEQANSKIGFYDPAEAYPRYINEPDCNRLAVNAQQSTDEDGDVWDKVTVNSKGTMISAFQRVKDGLKIPQISTSVADIRSKLASVRADGSNAVQSLKSVASGKKIDFASLKAGAIESNPAANLLLRRATQIKGVAAAAVENITNAKGELLEGNLANKVKDEIAKAAAKAVGAAITVPSISSILPTMDQPDIEYGSEYPFNHVYESESGHIREYDDTKDKERIHERHRTGTSYEIYADGTQSDKIVKHYFRSVAINEQNYVGGYKDVTVDGHYRVFINKKGEDDNHYDIQVGKGANINIQCLGGQINLSTFNDASINVNASGDYNLKVGKDYTLTVAGDMKEDVSGKRDSLTSGPWKLTGSRIDLNP